MGDSGRPGFGVRFAAPMSRLGGNLPLARGTILPTIVSMAIAENCPPRSLGLGGDGDEIAAIKEVERCFGVRLDYSNSQSWKTAGDVFAALQRALPAKRATEHDTWARFAEAISLETGVDHSLVTHQTLLLGQHRFDRRLLLVVAILIALTLAVVRHW